MTALKLLVLSSTLCFACSKKAENKDKDKPKDDTTTTTQADAAAAPTPDAEPVAAADAATMEPPPAADVDSIVVLAEHKEKKEGDPVKVNFKKFAVTKASFDPAKLDGASATIEIDATSLESGAPKRDQHLQTPDYLNVPKFAKIVIDVKNVKAKADKTYTADATVTALGVNKKFPVTFEVLEAKDDWVKVKGEHTFKRTDFQIGKPIKDENESVAEDLTIQLQLTIKKT